MLTQSKQVDAFEQEWSDWLGVRHSVFVNSGSSANLLTLAVLREQVGEGEIIVPTLTWVSDIAAVLQCGFTPVFVDIHHQTLGMDPEQVLKKITCRTKAVFLTHILGYNALTKGLLAALQERGIPLLEDVCESYGATFEGNKIGRFGLMSNFSFYYAHHMSTIEGGMISTDDFDIYQRLRMMRAHGMVRESTSPDLKNSYANRFADLNPDFIFAYPAYNVRSTELNAVLGRTQLKRLDAQQAIRNRNLRLFLNNLDPSLYQTEFAIEGSSNYAFTLVLRHPDSKFRDAVSSALQRCRVEFRRGMSGGGNQLRQPYLRQRFGEPDWSCYPTVEHIHFFGFYIGNYPDVSPQQILQLCDVLNGLSRS